MNILREMTQIYNQSETNFINQFAYYSGTWVRTKCTVHKTFYFSIFAFAQRALSLPSPFAHCVFTVCPFCLHRLLTLPSSFANSAFTAQFNSLRSALFVLSDPKASTVHSLCAQQSFSVCSQFRFN